MTNLIKECYSAIIASKTLCLKANNLTSCARGEVKTSGGYIWKYDIGHER